MVPPSVATICSSSSKAKVSTAPQYQDETKPAIIIGTTAAASSSYECHYCGQRCRCGPELAIHLRVHTGEKPYSCSVCHQSFAQAGTLSQHLRTHSGSKPYSCSTCHKKFTQQGSLTKHIRLHTNEKPYTCPAPKCGKKFSRVDDLRSHSKVHSGIKEYLCYICYKSFAYANTMKKHSLSHLHLDNDKTKTKK